MCPLHKKSISRFVLLMLMAVFALGGVAQTNRNIRKLQSQQAALKKQIAESEQLLRSNKKDVRSQLSNLEVLNTQISTQQQYVEGMRGQVDSLDRSIAVLQGQLDVLQSELTECKRKYHRSVMYMYRNRLVHNKLMFIFSAHNFREMFRRTRYMMEYAKYQRAQGEIVKRKEAAVREKRAALLSAKAEKSALLQEGKNVQAKLETQKGEREAVVAELNRQQAQLQSTINERKKKYNALNARIEQLIQQEIAAAERRRKEAEARRKREREERERKERAERERREREARAKKNRRNSGGSDNRSSASSRAGSSGATATPRFNAPDDADRALSNNFAANRGRLPVPITGSYVISSRYGQYAVEGLQGVQLDNKGINITGRQGAQARCVFDGEVSAVFAFGGLKNVIVRHGSYITVYCNLSSVSVRQGQKVSTRQTLGTVAPDGSGNCTLHFQLRKEASKLNPEVWIAR